MNLEAKITEMPNVNTGLEMSTLEFETWREFIHQRSGMYFPDNRQRFLHHHLCRRVRLHRMKSYNEYYHFVAYNSAGENEWEELFEQLINNETSFFRHLPSFDALSGQILPQLVEDKRNRGMKTISFWSAGCSTGQEAYSLAMVLWENSSLNLFNPDPRKSVDLGIDAPAHSVTGRGAPLSPMSTNHQTWRIKVSGSDISRRSIKIARRGRYKLNELRFIPDLYRDKYLTRIEDKTGGSFKIADQVHSSVQFGHLDLNDLSSYWITAQDVIFCQNVLIYFSPQRRDEIVNNLCRRLNPGGYLFLAPTEAVGLKLPSMRPVQCGETLIYKRNT